MALTVPNSDLDEGQTVRGLVAGQDVFHRYKLTRILGRGGMGVVWLARDEELERDVALKFLPDLIVHDRAVLDDLKRETRRNLQLTHHNIVRIYDFVHDPKSACISMEYVDGPTLSALRVEQPNKVFEPDKLAPLIKQACEALHYAHDHAKIVHRDVKPANLMLNSKGELKVADFGIARSLSDSASILTRARGTSGTLAYMSPQQITGERATHLDDIYSLGATIYEFLTGKPPFYSGDITDQIKSKLPHSMSQRRLDLEVAGGQPIPPSWENTIMACLSKNSASRPQSAIEIAAQLGSTMASVRPSPPPPPPAPLLAQRNGINLWYAGGAGMLVLIAAAFYYTSKPGKTQPLETLEPLRTPIMSPATDKPRELAATIRPSPAFTAATAPVATVNATTQINPSAPVSLSPTERSPNATNVVQAVPPPIAAAPAEQERFPETRTRLLAADEVRRWDNAKLRYAINELYARGGYDFRVAEIKAIFTQFSWYRQRVVNGRTQPQAAAQLSPLEYANLELLQKERDSRR
ncbi:MAG: protein kinase [Chthoniobacterales bacterium]